MCLDHVRLIWNRFQNKQAAEGGARGCDEAKSRGYVKSYSISNAEAAWEAETRLSGINM